MNIRLKLTLGIGLLFGFVVLLSLTGIVQINRLSGDTKNMLQANYNSLDYARNMLAVLDQPQRGSALPARFAPDLQRQERNVTEPGEAEATADLAAHFALWQQTPEDSVLPVLIRKDIYTIMQLNMAAVHRKSRSAEAAARDAALWITAAGTLCCLIAFVLLLNLPGSIADPVRELTRSIQQIAAQHYSQRVHFKGDRELVQLSDAFNSMAGKLEEYHNSSLAGLLMEKKRIDTLINNMRDPVIGLDEHHRLLFINEEALLVTGLRRGELLGRPVQDIALHNDLIRTLVQGLIPPAAANSTGRNPLRIYAHDKERFFEQETVTISVVPAGEKQATDIGHVILLKDITPFKELDTAKTNFIATVSHELKTPIAAIKMSLQLLKLPQTGALNEEQQLLLESIGEDGDRLLKITGELLDMTQAETGNIQLKPGLVRPETILHYALDAVSLSAEQRKISLVQELAPALPDIYADADKTVWVLVNLLTNAIRYAPEGSEVGIRIRPEKGKVYFGVSDRGKGIPQGYQSRLFDRYFQVPDNEKKGTGLGLAISREFIEAQGGSIGVESSPGNGSLFFFII